MSHAPTGVAVFDEVEDAFAVALVVVVVDGEEVAEIIEDDLLRIAEVDVEFFEFRAVGIASEDSAAVGAGEGFAILIDVVTAVADGPIEFAVGAEGEAVQVVSGETHAHAEAVDESFHFFGFSVAIDVLEAVDAGDHGEVNGAVFFNEAAGGACEGFVKVTTENGGLVGFAVSGGVFEDFDNFGLVVELIPLEKIGFYAGPLLVVSLAVFESHGGDVAIDAVAEIAVVFSAVANVLHLDAPAVGLGSINAVFSVDANRGDVIDLICSGELGNFCSLGNVNFWEFRRGLDLGLQRKDECESGGAAEGRDVHECREVIRAGGRGSFTDWGVIRSAADWRSYEFIRAAAGDHFAKELLGGERRCEVAAEAGS